MFYKRLALCVCLVAAVSALALAGMTNFNDLALWSDLNQTAKVRNNGVDDFGGPGCATGYGFVVGDTPITITKLGVWDGPGNVKTRNKGVVSDGLEEACVVKLWSVDSNTLPSVVLGQVTVQAGTASPLIGECRYESLANGIMLNANTTYILTFDCPTSGGNAFASCVPALAPHVKWNHDSPWFSGTWGHWDQWANVGPNAMFSPTPERDTIVLLAIGLTGLLAYGWRRRKEKDS